MKVLRYIVLLLALVIYAGGCSTSVMRDLHRTGLVTDDYRYGDLYRLSNLPQFRAAPPPCPKPQFPARLPDHLYVIGDSFLEPARIDSRDFPTEHYAYTHWERPRTVQLHPNRRNVLILESVERHFREHFGQVVNQIRVVSDSTRVQPEKVAEVRWPQRIREAEELISAPGIEERLETLLFGNDLFLWLKEQKARFNQHWFDRVNPKVTVTPNGQHVLYGLDTDSTLIHSSFSPVTDAEVARLVDSVNATAERYKRLGFDEVYLSIIPNKTSILAPELGRYNHLIERVQQHPALRVPVIDVYTPYQTSRQPVYQVGDSHWTCEGKAIWLREAAKIFRPAS